MSFGKITNDLSTKFSSHLEMTQREDCVQTQ